MIDEVVDDGFSPLVIGTYDANNAHRAHDMYDFALKTLEEKGRSFDVRANYMFPTGRVATGLEGGITPVTYGELLLELFERWIHDYRGIDIVLCSRCWTKHLELSRAPAALGPVDVAEASWLLSPMGTFLTVQNLPILAILIFLTAISSTARIEASLGLPRAGLWCPRKRATLMV